MVEGPLRADLDGWPAELELGVAGRTLAGESRSGDLAVFTPYARGGLAVVIDGLGHGDEAADASAIAAEVIREHADDAPDALLATAISEVARNITTYAVRGEVLLSIVRDAGPPAREGIRVVARDDGPGIEDVDLAMQDGYTSGGGLGLGLPGARRLVDEFDIVTAPRAGTTVTLVKWSRAR